MEQFPAPKIHIPRSQSTLGTKAPFHPTRCFTIPPDEIQPYLLLQIMQMFATSCCVVPIIEVITDER